MYKDKAYVCNVCRKIISYAATQAGTTTACPFCGETVTFPALNKSSQSQSPLSVRSSLSCPKKRRFASCLLTFVGVPLAIALALAAALAGGLFRSVPVKPPPQLQPYLLPLTSRGLLPATAPTTVAYANSGLAVTVTSMTKDRPLIFHTSFQKSAAAETPVFCVAVTITNKGKEPALYRSWRDLLDEGDVKTAATLQDSQGTLHGLVSFGPGTWPLGAQHRIQIASDASANDILLFQCGDEPAGDYLLTLPGANLGRPGELRFLIPREMVQ